MSFLARSLVRSLTASHAFGGPELWSSVGTTEGALSASDRNGMSFEIETSWNVRN